MAYRVIDKLKRNARMSTLRKNVKRQLYKTKREFGSLYINKKRKAYDSLTVVSTKEHLSLPKEDKTELKMTESEDVMSGSPRADCRVSHSLAKMKQHKTQKKEI